MTLAQQRLDAARDQATEISAQISAAQTQQAKLEAEIADAEANIPRAARPRRRAAGAGEANGPREMYVRHGEHGGVRVGDGRRERARTACRAAHLTDTIGTHDLDVADRAAGDRGAARGTGSGAQGPAAPTSQKTLASLAPLNDLLQQKLAVASAAYDKVHALVTDDPTKHGVDVATGATECPVKGVVVFTDDFGELRPGGPHPGIDMGALTGTPVVAVADRVHASRRRRRRRQRRVAHRPRQRLLLLRALLAATRVTGGS